MLPDRVSNPAPLTYESGALPIALCSPANGVCIQLHNKKNYLQDGMKWIRMERMAEWQGQSPSLHFTDLDYPVYFIPSFKLCHI